MAAREAGLGRGTGIRGRGQRITRSLIGAIDVVADQGAQGAILFCMEQSFILDEDDDVIPGASTPPGSTPSSPSTPRWIT